MEQNDKTCKILSSEYIIRRPWLTARRDCLEMPGGKINDEYYVLEYPDWVNIIAITKEGKYVFVRQYRHGIGRVLDEIVAGVMEPGEEPLEAAKRELAEETGFGGGRWEEVMALSQNASACTNLSHSFIARDVEKISEQHLDPTEDIDVLLLSREEVFGMMQRGEILQSLMAAPLWRHFAMEGLIPSDNVKKG